MKRMIFSAALLVAALSFANAQQANTTQKTCKKTEQCEKGKSCKAKDDAACDKKAEKKECCKKKAGEEKACCKKQAGEKKCCKKAAENKG